MKYRQIRVSEIVANELEEIVERRRLAGSLVNTRIAVISEAIRKIHNRECK